MYDRDMRYDGRRMPPRNSRGEFMSRGRGRGRRGDRGMDYGMHHEMRGDGRVIRSYPNTYPRGDYAGDMTYDMARGDSRTDMRSGDYRGDMHHGGMGRGGYEPVEFMGYCSGYYGTPQGDYGRGRDYGYDMRGRRDYGYDDYGYRDYGDYGETLSEKELEHWNKKLMSQLDEREKQMFSKEAVIQRAKAMGAKMEGFGENELYTTCLMIFSDYKRSIGANLDLTIKLALDWLNDQDSAVKGAEKLSIYHDEVIMGGED